MGSDITKQFYRENDIESILQIFCGRLHKSALYVMENLGNNQKELFRYNTKLKFMVPAIINRNDLAMIQQGLIHFIYDKFGEEHFINECIKCETRTKCNMINQYSRLGEFSFAFFKHFTELYLEHYKDNNLCLKVLFVE